MFSEKCTTAGNRRDMTSIAWLASGADNCAASQADSGTRSISLSSILAFQVLDFRYSFR